MPPTEGAMDLHAKESLPTYSESNYQPKITNIDDTNIKMQDRTKAHQPVAVAHIFARLLVSDG